MAPQRLQKILSQLGVVSRRGSEALIERGLVTINGVTAHLGDTVSAGDVVAFDGRVLHWEAPRQHRTFALHKPAGYVCSASDELGRRGVIEMMPAVPGLHAVGRLDKDSEGLLILTTDGALTLRLTHPRHGHRKHYRVWTEVQPTEADLRRLLDGVVLEDGLAVAAEARTSEGGAEIVLSEGRKRQVRRMMDELGCPVWRLLRYRVGNLWLGDLQAGEWYELGADELAWLEQPEDAELSPAQRDLRQETEGLWL